MEFSVSAHVALLDSFLDRSGHIIAEIERRLLNIQGRRSFPLGDRVSLDNMLSSCFFDSAGDFGRLKGQLSSAHRSDGFEPVQQEAGAHDFDPAPLVTFAHSYWTHSRWPGRNGRIAYAQTIYSVFVLNQLQQLSLRIWDDGHECATPHFREIQRLLDRLNNQSGPNIFVRTAAWLLQSAQGPLTRMAQPYFIVAERISESLEDDHRLQVYRAGALLAGGHLRSQLRYRATEGHGFIRTQATEEHGFTRTQTTDEHGFARTQATEEHGFTRTQATEEHGFTRTQTTDEHGFARIHRSIDDPEVLSVTRNSNSMDVALLIRDLVPLLEAYERACNADARDIRRMLSDVILQGLSVDPELLLTRLDILGPATMIEDVFIEPKQDRGFGYTHFGSKHLDVLSKYRSLIIDLAAALKEDAQHVDPTRSAYSPFGIVYGFCADILSNMAISKLISPGTPTLTLEDLFSTSDAAEDKLAKARRWEALPRQHPERGRFEYSAEWAAEIFGRLTTALDMRSLHGNAPNASGRRSARVFVVQESHAEQSGNDVLGHATAVSAQEHCVTSDLKRALATGATAFPRSQILSDRREGRFLASVECEGKWFAVSKVLLTTHVCEGMDVVIADVPPTAMEILRLTCPGLMEVCLRD